jgi:hypothetical protein
VPYLGVLRLRAPAWPGRWPKPQKIARARWWLSPAAGEAGLAGANRAGDCDGTAPRRALLNPVDAW